MIWESCSDLSTQACAGLAERPNAGLAALHRLHPRLDRGGGNHASEAHAPAVTPHPLPQPDWDAGVSGHLSDGHTAAGGVEQASTGREKSGKRGSSLASVVEMLLLLRLHNTDFTAALTVSACVCVCVRWVDLFPQTCFGGKTVK